MKLTWAFALVLLITLPASAFAHDLALIKGRRAPSVFEGQVEQFLSVKNNGSQTMNAMVECGFVKGDGVEETIVDTGSAGIVNLKPGQTAYEQITSSGAFDRAECRISVAYPVAPQ
jgi:hypothetical protein